MFKRMAAVLLTAGALTVGGAGVASASVNDDILASISAKASVLANDVLLTNLSAKAPISAYKGTLLEVGAGATSG